MEKKKILLDVDEVICNTGFLPLMNEFLGTNYKYDDFTDYFMDGVLGDRETRERFYKFYLQHNDYNYAQLLPGAFQVIKRLHLNYDLYICSACVNPYFVYNSGKVFMDKYDWLVQVLPFIDPYKIIFTNTKNIFKTDIQIDDRIDNLKGDVPVKLLFTSYHNKDISDKKLEQLGIIRVKDWRAVERELISQAGKVRTRKKIVGEKHE